MANFIKYLLKFTYLFIGILLVNLSSCKDPFYEKELRPVRPETQIRFINFSNKEKIRVEVRVQEQENGRIVERLRTINLDTLAQSEYIPQPFGTFRTIKIFKQSSNEPVFYDGPLNLVETNSLLNRDTSEFAFEKNKVYGFYILPEEARKIRVGESIRNYGVAFQVLQEEIEDAFPQKAKLRFINFTSSRGVKPDKDSPYNSLVSLPNVLIPQAYTCNPGDYDFSTGQFKENPACKFNYLNDNIFNGVLGVAQKTFSDYQLINDGDQNLYLVLGNINAAVATFRYPLPLESGGVYSAVLSGEVDFSKIGENFGITLRLYREGTNTPAQIIDPLPGGQEARLRYISNAFNVDDQRVVFNGTLNLLNISSTAYNAVLPEARYNIRILGPTPIPVFYETEFNVQASKAYTIYGGPSISNTALDGWIVEDDVTAAPTNKVKLRFVNLAFNSEPIDLKIGSTNGTIVSTNVQYRQFGNYFELQANDEVTQTPVPHVFYFTKSGTNENVFIADPFTQLGDSFLETFTSGDVVTIVLGGSYDPSYGTLSVRFIK